MPVSAPPVFWSLRFRKAAGSPLDELTEAFGRALGQRVEPRFTAWEGNPRDYYARMVSATAMLAGALRADFTLGHQTSYDGGDAHHFSACSVSVSVGPCTDGAIATLAALWESLRSELAALGYADATLSEGPAAIIDAYLRVGDWACADELKARSFEAYRESLRALPAHWPVVVTRARLDDWEGLLGGVDPVDARSSIALDWDELTALPRALGRFTACRDLSLMGNQLAAVDLSMQPWTQLERLILSGNPLADFGVQQIEVLPALRVLDLKATPLGRDAGAVEALRRARPDVDVRTSG